MPPLPPYVDRDPLPRAVTGGATTVVDEKGGEARTCNKNDKIFHKSRNKGPLVALQPRSFT
jgi:hypothetical protein